MRKAAPAHASALLCGRDVPRPAPGARGPEVAAYVAQMSGDLAAMARSSRLDTLGYLLEMTRREALRLAGGDGSSSPST
jgi:hypothetical protein